MALERFVAELTREVALEGSKGCTLSTLWLIASELISDYAKLDAHSYIDSECEDLEGMVADYFDDIAEPDTLGFRPKTSAAARYCPFAHPLLLDKRLVLTCLRDGGMIRCMRQRPSVMSGHGGARVVRPVPMSGVAGLPIQPPTDLEEIPWDLALATPDDGSIVLFASFPLRCVVLGLTDTGIVNRLDAKRWAVLEAIGYQRWLGIRQRDLSTLLNESSGSISLYVKQLEGMGLIQRANFLGTEGDGSGKGSAVSKSSVGPSQLSIRLWLTNFIDASSHPCFHIIAAKVANALSVPAETVPNVRHSFYELGVDRCAFDIAPGRGAAGHHAWMAAHIVNKKSGTGQGPRPEVAVEDGADEDMARGESSRVKSKLPQIAPTAVYTDSALATVARDSRLVIGILPNPTKETRVAFEDAINAHVRESRDLRSFSAAVQAAVAQPAYDGDDAEARRSPLAIGDQTAVTSRSIPRLRVVQSVHRVQRIMYFSPSSFGFQMYAPPALVKNPASLIQDEWKRFKIRAIVREVSPSTESPAQRIERLLCEAIIAQSNANLRLRERLAQSATLRGDAQSPSSSASSSSSSSSHSDTDYDRLLEYDNQRLVQLWRDLASARLEAAICEVPLITVASFVNPASTYGNGAGTAADACVESFATKVAGDHALEVARSSYSNEPSTLRSATLGADGSSDVDQDTEAWEKLRSFADRNPDGAGQIACSDLDAYCTDYTSRVIVVCEETNEEFTIPAPNGAPFEDFVSATAPQSNSATMSQMSGLISALPPLFLRSPLLTFPAPALPLLGADLTLTSSGPQHDSNVSKEASVDGTVEAQEVVDEDSVVDQASNVNANQSLAPTMEPAVQTPPTALAPGCNPLTMARLSQDCNAVIRHMLLPEAPCFALSFLTKSDNIIEALRARWNSPMPSIYVATALTTLPARVVMYVSQILQSAMGREEQFVQSTLRMLVSDQKLAVAYYDEPPVGSIMRVPPPQPAISNSLVAITTSDMTASPERLIYRLIHAAGPTGLRSTDLRLFLPFLSSKRLSNAMVDLRKCGTVLTRTEYMGKLVLFRLFAPEFAPVDVLVSTYRGVEDSNPNDTTLAVIENATLRARVGDRSVAANNLLVLTDELFAAAGAKPTPNTPKRGRPKLSSPRSAKGKGKGADGKEDRPDGDESASDLDGQGHSDGMSDSDASDQREELASASKKPKRRTKVGETEEEKEQQGSDDLPSVLKVAGAQPRLDFSTSTYFARSLTSNSDPPTSDDVPLSLSYEQIRRRIAAGLPFPPQFTFSKKVLRQLREEGLHFVHQPPAVDTVGEFLAPRVLNLDGQLVQPQRVEQYKTHPEPDIAIGHPMDQEPVEIKSVTGGLIPSRTRTDVVEQRVVAIMEYMQKHGAVTFTVLRRHLVELEKRSRGPQPTLNSRSMSRLIKIIMKRDPGIHLFSITDPKTPRTPVHGLATAEYKPEEDRVLAAKLLQERQTMISETASEAMRMTMVRRRQRRKRPRRASTPGDGEEDDDDEDEEDAEDEHEDQEFGEESSQAESEEEDQWMAESSSSEGADASSEDESGSDIEAPALKSRSQRYQEREQRRRASVNVPKRQRNIIDMIRQRENNDGDDDDEKPDLEPIESDGADLERPPRRPTLERKESKTKDDSEANRASQSKETVQEPSASPTLALLADPWLLMTELSTYAHVISDALLSSRGVTLKSYPQVTYKDVETINDETWKAEWELVYDPILDHPLRLQLYFPTANDEADRASLHSGCVLAASAVTSPESGVALLGAEDSTIESVNVNTHTTALRGPSGRGAAVAISKQLYRHYTLVADALDLEIGTFGMLLDCVNPSKPDHGEADAQGGTATSGGDGGPSLTAVSSALAMRYFKTYVEPPHTPFLLVPDWEPFEHKVLPPISAEASSLATQTALVGMAPEHQILLPHITVTRCSMVPSEVGLRSVPKHSMSAAAGLGRSLAAYLEDSSLLHTVAVMRKFIKASQQREATGEELGLENLDSIISPPPQAPTRLAPRISELADAISFDAHLMGLTYNDRNVAQTLFYRDTSGPQATSLRSAANQTQSTAGITCRDFSILPTSTAIPTFIEHVCHHTTQPTIITHPGMLDVEVPSTMRISHTLESLKPIPIGQSTRTKSRDLIVRRSEMKDLLVNLNAAADLQPIRSPGSDSQAPWAGVGALVQVFIQQQGVETAHGSMSSTKRSFGKWSKRGALMAIQLAPLGDSWLDELLQLALHTALQLEAEEEATKPRELLELSRANIRRSIAPIVAFDVYFHMTTLSGVLRKNWSELGLVLVNVQFTSSIESEDSTLPSTLLEKARERVFMKNEVSVSRVLCALSALRNLVHVDFTYLFSVLNNFGNVLRLSPGILALVETIQEIASGSADTARKCWVALISSIRDRYGTLCQAHGVISTMNALVEIPPWEQLHALEIGEPGTDAIAGSPMKTGESRKRRPKSESVKTEVEPLSLDSAQEVLKNADPSLVLLAHIVLSAIAHKSYSYYNMFAEESEQHKLHFAEAILAFSAMLQPHLQQSLGTRHVFTKMDRPIAPRSLLETLRAFGKNPIKALSKYLTARNLFITDPEGGAGVAIPSESLTFVNGLVKDGIRANSFPEVASASMPSILATIAEHISTRLTRNGVIVALDASRLGLLDLLIEDTSTGAIKIRSEALSLLNLLGETRLLQFCVQTPASQSLSSVPVITKVPPPMWSLLAARRIPSALLPASLNNAQKTMFYNLLTSVAVPVASAPSADQGAQRATNAEDSIRDVPLAELLEDEDVSVVTAADAAANHYLSVSSMAAQGAMQAAALGFQPVLARRAAILLEWLWIRYQQRLAQLKDREHGAAQLNPASEKSLVYSCFTAYDLFEELPLYLYLQLVGVAVCELPLLPYQGELLAVPIKDLPVEYRAPLTSMTQHSLRDSYVIDVCMLLMTLGLIQRPSQLAAQLELRNADDLSASQLRTKALRLQSQAALFSTHQRLSSAMRFALTTHVVINGIRYNITLRPGREYVWRVIVRQIAIRHLTTVQYARTARRAVRRRKTTRAAEDQATGLSSRMAADAHGLDAPSFPPSSGTGGEMSPMEQLDVAEQKQSLFPTRWSYLAFVPRMHKAFDHQRAAADPVVVDPALEQLVQRSACASQRQMHEELIAKLRAKVQKLRERRERAAARRAAAARNAQERRADRAAAAAAAAAEKKTAERSDKAAGSSLELTLRRLVDIDQYQHPSAEDMDVHDTIKDEPFSADAQPASVDQPMLVPSTEEEDRELVEAEQALQAALEEAGMNPGTEATGRALDHLLETALRFDVEFQRLMPYSHLLAPHLFTDPAADLQADVWEVSSAQAREVSEKLLASSSQTLLQVWPSLSRLLRANGLVEPLRQVEDRIKHMYEATGTRFRSVAEHEESPSEMSDFESESDEEEEKEGGAGRRHRESLHSQLEQAGRPGSKRIQLEGGLPGTRTAAQEEPSDSDEEQEGPRLGKVRMRKRSTQSESAEARAVRKERAKAIMSSATTLTTTTVSTSSSVVMPINYPELSNFDIMAAAARATAAGGNFMSMATYHQSDSSSSLYESQPLTRTSIGDPDDGDMPPLETHADVMFDQPLGEGEMDLASGMQAGVVDTGDLELVQTALIVNGSPISHVASYRGESKSIFDKSIWIQPRLSAGSMLRQIRALRSFAWLFRLHGQFVRSDTKQSLMPTYAPAYDMLTVPLAFATVHAVTYMTTSAYLNAQGPRTSGDGSTYVITEARLTSEVESSQSTTSYMDFAESVRRIRTDRALLTEDMHSSDPEKLRNNYFMRELLLQYAEQVDTRRNHVVLASAADPSALPPTPAFPAFLLTNVPTLLKLSTTKYADANQVPIDVTLSLFASLWLPFVDAAAAGNSVGFPGFEFLDRVTRETSQLVWSSYFNSRAYELGLQADSTSEENQPLDSEAIKSWEVARRHPADLLLRAAGRAGELNLLYSNRSLVTRLELYRSLESIFARSRPYSAGLMPSWLEKDLTTSVVVTTASYSDPRYTVQRSHLAVELERIAKELALPTEAISESLSATGDNIARQIKALRDFSVTESQPHVSVAAALDDASGSQGTLIPINESVMTTPLSTQRVPLAWPTISTKAPSAPISPLITPANAQQREHEHVHIRIPYLVQHTVGHMSSPTHQHHYHPAVKPSFPSVFHLGAGVSDAIRLDECYMALFTQLRTLFMAGFFCPNNSAQRAADYFTNIETIWESRTVRTTLKLMAKGDPEQVLLHRADKPAVVCIVTLPDPLSKPPHGGPFALPFVIGPKFVQQVWRRLHSFYLQSNTLLIMKTLTRHGEQISRRWPEDAIAAGNTMSLSLSNASLASPTRSAIASNGPPGGLPIDPAFALPPAQSSSGTQTPLAGTPSQRARRLGMADSPGLGPSSPGLGASRPTTPVREMHTAQYALVSSEHWVQFRDQLPILALRIAAALRILERLGTTETLIGALSLSTLRYVSTECAAGLSDPKESKFASMILPEMLPRAPPDGAILTSPVVNVCHNLLQRHNLPTPTATAAGAQQYFLCALPMYGPPPVMTYLSLRLRRRSELSVKYRRLELAVLAVLAQDTSLIGMTVEQIAHSIAQLPEDGGATADVPIEIEDETMAAGASGVTSPSKNRKQDAQQGEEAKRLSTPKTLAYLLERATYPGIFTAPTSSTGVAESSWDVEAHAPFGRDQCSGEYCIPASHDVYLLWAEYADARLSAADVLTRLALIEPGRSLPKTKWLRSPTPLELAIASLLQTGELIRAVCSRRVRYVTNQHTAAVRWKLPVKHPLEPRDATDSPVLAALAQPSSHQTSVRGQIERSEAGQFVRVDSTLPPHLQSAAESRDRFFTALRSYVKPVKFANFSPTTDIFRTLTAGDVFNTPFLGTLLSTMASLLLKASSSGVALPVLLREALYPLTYLEALEFVWACYVTELVSITVVTTPSQAQRSASSDGESPHLSPSSSTTVICYDSSLTEAVPNLWRLSGLFNSYETTSEAPAGGPGDSDPDRDNFVGSNIFVHWNFRYAPRQHVSGGAGSASHATTPQLTARESTTQ